MLGFNSAIHNGDNDALSLGQPMRRIDLQEFKVPLRVAD